MTPHRYITAGQLCRKIGQRVGRVRPFDGQQQRQTRVYGEWRGIKCLLQVPATPLTTGSIDVFLAVTSLADCLPFRS
ncbi:hypothetical protein BaRGS_00006777 [Batillaria attramentaria]|uniref:Uncharacterized protein n=1 Tax=Batillaria attramentaria TaxID=370345 RepID=A0ABD0LR36_9CAEN